MNQGQVGTRNGVTGRLERSMRKYALSLPVFVAGYGYLIQEKLVTGSQYFTLELFLFVVVSSTILATLQVFIVKQTKVTRAIFLVGYHLILGISLLLVYGILSPLIFAWLLLIVVTMMVYGKRWALLSYAGLILLMIVSSILSGDYTSAAMAQYFITAVLMGGVVAVFSSLHTIEYLDQEKLARTRAQRNDQREALLTIINGTNQAIFTVSANGIIRIYNAALLNLIDTNQSLSGQRVDDVLGLYDQTGEPVSLYSLMRSNTHFERDDLTLRFNDGDEIRLHLSVNKIQSAFSADHQNDGEGYVCIARDVTKQKSLEEERDEFIAVVSHELRTPVTIAEGTISNLQYFLENGADPVKLTPSLKEAHEQVLLLANMINDLGTLSRAERGVGDQSEEIDIKELAETLYNSYHTSASKKGLTLDLDLGHKLGTIQTSRLYLEEMLQNFITNSIKYTSEGTVTVHIKRTPLGVEFAVSDTGIGMSKADLKHIFEKFYRSEDYRTRETSGTGLGLYVVTKLMQKLDTKVDVKSRLNHGSTFSFVLPDTATKTNA